jgi:hypothetical protein
VINKKLPKNQTNLEEDEYKSLTLIYYGEANTMVPLVIINIGTPPKMQRSWNDDNNKTLEVMV